MTGSVNRRSGWQVPIWIRVKQSLLLALLALFSTVHVLTAASAQNDSIEPGLQLAPWVSEAVEELNATIETNESSVTLDLALRDVSLPTEQTIKCRGKQSEQTSGLKRYWRPGTNGPPSNNNLSA